MGKCIVCGETRFFLRRKGSAVGLYCSECQKWVKWVSKKDVKTFESKGYKVFSEDYDPASASASVSKNMSSSPLGVETEIPPFLDEEVSFQHNSNDKVPCLVCETGFLKGLSESDRVSASITENTLVISSRTTGVYLGSFEVNFCLKCGRKIE